MIHIIIGKLIIGQIVRRQVVSHGAQVDDQRTCFLIFKISLIKCFFPFSNEDERCKLPLAKR